MRILYLTQYFPPEVGATQARAWEMARGLVRAGHEVTVVTEVPNHPQGVVRAEFRGKLWARETVEGIDVIRVWVKTTPSKTFRARLVFYGTFMLSATLAGLVLARGRYDLVYATSPPLPVGGAARAISRLRGIPLVFEVRDLWPASAIALGALRSPRARRWASRLEERCYRRARAIVAVTRGIEAALVERGIPKEKIHFVPNGANVEELDVRPDGRSRTRAALGIDDKFVALYAGIHGLAQGLGTVLDAAALLEEQGGFHFVLVGDGPKKRLVEARVAELGLRNVTLLPECPRSEVADILSAADGVLVPLRDVPLFRGALPSKMFDGWACRRPLVLGIDGEARDLLERAGGGVAVKPEDPEALAAGLRRLRDDPEEATAMGERGRLLTEREHSRSVLAARLVGVLEGILG